jgi:hypothetical protein
LSPTQTLTPIKEDSDMAKFYIQSGSIRAVVDSVDIDRAALWAVNEVMSSTLPLDERSRRNSNLASPLRLHSYQRARV